MKYPSPLRVPPGVQMGLRVQIVLALAGLMLLAFVPLFFAVASLTRATMLGAREHAALALGHAIAVQVADARARGGATEIERALDVCARSGDIEAACAFGADGSRIACVGSPAAAGAIPSPLGLGESAEIVRGATGRALEIATHAGGLSVVTHLRAEGAANDGSRLVRLVALYMATFALALLVFAYFVLTRLIVRPVEQLVDAADRVANGARTLRVPRSGARELIDLGASVQAMAERLIREEAALILKVEELTQTTTRLTQAQRQLVRSERMASVGQLAAGLAHEIGNPITALMGMQDLLLDGQLSQEAQRDFLQRMRRETERIHAVVRGLLDFARPEGGHSEREGPGTASVLAVVEDVVGLVAPHKPFRQVQIETDIDASLEVALPASRLTQVLLNIVLNAGAAIAATGRGGGRIVIRARAADGQVRIEIEDDGPGIAAEVRDRLFEPFVTTKGVGEGTGLGLAVCRGLVESAGGEIGAHPSRSAGALFYVVLPSPAG
ncbi:MAG: HAMP domain-containing sensor histidine kinase [Polyangiaceae bacterium]